MMSKFGKVVRYRLIYANLNLDLYKNDYKKYRTF
jgi:hypothetical protein